MPSTAAIRSRLRRLLRPVPKPAVPVVPAPADPEPVVPVPVASEPAPRPSLVRAGMVEKFAQDRLVGWVAVAVDAPPIRITLQLNGRDVVTTWATEPTDRTNWGETRPFRLWLSDIWTYTRTDDRLVVSAEGLALPIYRVGMYRNPDRGGKSSPWMLKSKMLEGYVFGQTGGLQLSKSRDLAWQRAVLGLFRQIREFVADELGYDVFFIYGTLLGAVREGGFIGHDLDLDLAYVSARRDGPSAAAELRDLGLALIDAGYVVESFLTHLHVTDAEETRIDIFHIYFDADDRLAFPFGIAGTTTITRAEWRGVEEIEFCGAVGVLPVLGEQLAEHLYGPGWRAPQPGFMWYLDRTTRAADGMMPPAMVEEIYWANFYARHRYATPSTFFDVVAGRPDLPATVVDLGCGDGRDAVAFGQRGRTVLGLDRDPVGIRHAESAARTADVAGLVRFAVCDLGDAERLTTLVRTAIAAADGPVLFYLRFLLHSIPADVQEVLLAVLADCARPGDLFAAEFRTDADEDRPKIHGGHYRRFQNGPAFGAQLSERFGFDVLDEQEGTGLAPYRDEDPALYRVIARRRDEGRSQ